jgi:dihydroorotate dehydrogenase (fumarate)
MPDLRTTYLGLELPHPLVASASPMSKDLDGVKRLAEAGAAAIVLFSLFEEQIRHERAALAHLTEVGTEAFAEALSYFPDPDRYRVGPDRYLELVRRARAATGIPIIASLNGVTSEGWIDHAALLQEAGATALELNVYFMPASLEMTGREVEERVLAVLRAVKARVSIPVAMKLSPFFSAFGHMARQLDDAGADGLVLFNRFYQPDFDLERREVVPSLDLSTPAELRLPLRWIALLHGRVRASLAATTGVHSALEAVKVLMAGADAVMTTSALLLRGPEHLRTIAAGLTEWLERHELASVTQMKGSMSQRNVADPTAFERANYLKVLESYR